MSPWRKIMRSGPFSFMAGLTLRIMIAWAHLLGRERTAGIARFGCRVIGPMLPEHRTAKRNIAIAFPEKSDEERKAILNGCWDNFAKVVVEFLFLEKLADGYDPDDPKGGSITVEGFDIFERLRDDGKPAVIFAAHIANWEILGVVSAKFGLDTVIPFRAPMNVHVARDVLDQREKLMGRLIGQSRGAAFQIASALDAGAHLGMLVDQRLNQGPLVPFFGRYARTNPMAAKLARQYDCPVHGARAIRLPDGRFHLELTPEIELERDKEGLIDVGKAMVRINAEIEGWIREHPEQYFWLHDRWKSFPKDAKELERMGAKGPDDIQD